MKPTTLTVASLAVALVCLACRSSQPGVAASEPGEARVRSAEESYNRGSREKDPLLADLLTSNPDLQRVAAEAERHRLQIVLGTVEETAAGPRLAQRTYRAGAEYFYPASSVKMFAAIAALEHLEALRRTTRHDIDVDTALVYEPLFADEVREAADPSNLVGGVITTRHEIRKLFLVSDNQAYNRLYEMVGQDGLMRSLENAGLVYPRIVHRLSEARSPEDNRRYPEISFRGDTFEYWQDARESEPLRPIPPAPRLQVGKAHMQGGERIKKPMDMSVKNQISLVDLQRGLCMVVRPDVDCNGSGFALRPEDRELLLEAMSQLPRQSKNPVYDPNEYPDDYVKALRPGVARVVPSDRVVIYNKTGQAYGFSTENAYVVDSETGRSFFLAATLYTNENEALNDDQYEYDEVATPFMEALGEAVARRVWG